MAVINKGQYKENNTKSVSKTLEILSTFTEENPMQKTSDIAVNLKMNMSTVSRHLNTLLDWGFLQRDELTGFYYPGLAIVSLAGVTLQNNDIYRHAYPELQRISYKHQVHSHMGVPNGDKVVHLISNACENTMNLHIPMGHCHPMYCSAMGRSILAYMSPSQALDVVKNSNLIKHTMDTKIDLIEIQQELIKTRQKGYTLLVNELVEGKGSIAAPILDRNRNVVASISISASTDYLQQPEKEKELARAVMMAAGKISSKLGYFPK